MPTNRIFIFSPFFSSKTISTSNSFSKSSVIMNTTICLFEDISFTSILASTIRTYLIPFIVGKTKRANNIPFTKFLNKMNFPRGRSTRITMRSKYSNSFKNLFIYPIIWATYTFSITSNFKFFNCMFTKITMLNNISKSFLINKIS